MLTGEEAEEGGDSFDYVPWAISRFVRLLSHLAALRLPQLLNNDASSHNSIN